MAPLFAMGAGSYRELLQELVVSLLREGDPAPADVKRTLYDAHAIVLGFTKVRGACTATEDGCGERLVVRGRSPCLQVEGLGASPSDWETSLDQWRDALQQQEYPELAARMRSIQEQLRR